MSERVERSSSSALDDIASERKRQIEGEGWTAEHDDAHDRGEMASAAACYCIPIRDPVPPPSNWPWDAKWWKPKDRRRDLVRAAALIVAEIERLDRNGECQRGYDQAPHTHSQLCDDRN